MFNYYIICNFMLCMLGITAYTMNRAWKITGDTFYFVATILSGVFVVLILIVMNVYPRFRRRARD